MYYNHLIQLYSLLGSDNPKQIKRTTGSYTYTQKIVIYEASPACIKINYDYCRTRSSEPVVSISNLTFRIIQYT